MTLPSYKPPKPGFIYAASNPSFTGLLKIGKTTRQPEDRLRELSQIIPTAYRLEYAVAVEHPSKCEHYVHFMLYPFRVNTQREFFRVDLAEARRYMDDATRATQPPTMDDLARAMTAITERLRG